MDKLQINYFVDLLSVILKNPNKKNIYEFQNIIWNLDTMGDEYEILREIAYDLDYYESDPNICKEDASYYGNDKLANEVRIAIDQLNVLGEKSNLAQP